jgi:surfactin synthase thioesterase subunit
MEQKRINLFCFPFAGGSSYSYNEFKDFCPAFVRLVPVEVPGRGTRYKEQLLTNISDIVEDVFINIKDKLNQPYAIYGHSMGALIAYLIAHKIKMLKLDNPLHLFVSGAGAPAYRDTSVKPYLMPREVFFEIIKKMGGLTKEVSEDGNLMAFFEPILRADFQAVDEYKYEKRDSVLDVPISCMIGTHEKVTREDAELWKLETQNEVSIHQFVGNHFFIFQNTQRIMQLIGDTLLSTYDAYIKEAYRQ